MPLDRSFLIFTILITFSAGLMLWSTAKFGKPFFTVDTSAELVGENSRTNPFAGGQLRNLSGGSHGDLLDANSPFGVIPPEVDPITLLHEGTKELSKDGGTSRGDQPESVTSVRSHYSDLVRGREPVLTLGQQDPSASQRRFQPPAPWEISREEWFGLRLRQLNPWFPAVSDGETTTGTSQATGPASPKGRASDGAVSLWAIGQTRGEDEPRHENSTPNTSVANELSLAGDLEAFEKPNPPTQPKGGARLRFPLQSRRDTRREGGFSSSIRP